MTDKHKSKTQFNCNNRQSEQRLQYDNKAPIKFQQKKVYTYENKFTATMDVWKKTSYDKKELLTHLLESLSPMYTIIFMSGAQLANSRCQALRVDKGTTRMKGPYIWCA